MGLPILFQTFDAGPLQPNAQLSLLRVQVYSLDFKHLADKGLAFILRISTDAYINTVCILTFFICESNMSWIIMD